VFSSALYALRTLLYITSMYHSVLFGLRTILSHFILCTILSHFNLSTILSLIRLYHLVLFYSVYRFVLFYPLYHFVLFYPVYRFVLFTQSTVLSYLLKVPFCPYQFRTILSYTNLGDS